ncbi:hypothetical protein NAB1_1674 [Lactiplantibacillus plantarum]|uniref:Mobile element protein n=1 Tax=Lactiplantibacillus plantarum TaxID=1590 RepID=A0AAW3RK53_LACPN|nr:hypothetical protein NAB1_1674 [Lactiplantibacillus plantarum]KZV06414.1 hypothetical protein NAB2_0033 [Lactiplantibacillus plantarum]
MVGNWERKLIEGRLKSSKGRSLEMADKAKQPKTLNNFKKKISFYEYG